LDGYWRDFAKKTTPETPKPLPEIDLRQKNAPKEKRKSKIVFLICPGNLPLSVANSHLFIRIQRHGIPAPSAIYVSHGFTQRASITFRAADAARTTQVQRTKVNRHAGTNATRKP